MKTAIYPFSGDPITFGHIDIIERTAKKFDKVIAAIGINIEKTYLFNLSDRLYMAKDALRHLSNVEVASYNGLLTDFARMQGTNIIVRGIRNLDDFNYEWMLHNIYESLDTSIEVIWLPCKKRLENTSSSILKQRVKSGESIINSTTPLVASMLYEKLHT